MIPNTREQAMLRHCLETIGQNLETFNPYNSVRYNQISDSITVPEGPWDTSPNETVLKDVKQNLTPYGCEFDDKGRPVHPWYRELLKTCGVVSGKGQYYYWGPNYTVDPVVFAEPEDPKLLLIQREKNLRWALPGGFVDPGEGKEQAARRETKEETHLILPRRPGIEVYDGLLSDERITANAWGHTTAIMWVLERAVKVTPGDDALAAEWFPIDRLPTDNMHGSHQKLIEFALEGLYHD